MGLPVFRSAGDPANPAVLLVHGYPESSHMWRASLNALAESGLYAVAPDLPGFGDSPPDPPGTWERHVEVLEALRRAEALGRVALVGHDWGGLIGLRWACDHPDAVWAVVASDTGFFPDGRWHGMAEAMRTPGQGEEHPFAPVAGAQRFAREISGARVQVIPGTGHFVLEDAPETAAQALAAFLAE